MYRKGDLKKRKSIPILFINPYSKMARLVGFEPATFSLEGNCSSHWATGAITSSNAYFIRKACIFYILVLVYTLTRIF